MSTDPTEDTGHKTCSRVGVETTSDAESRKIAKHPCAVRDGKFVEPCSSLESIIDHRRVKEIQLFNWATREPTRTFIVLHAGEHTKKGIALNCCPFCATRIDAPFVEASNV